MASWRFSIANLVSRAATPPAAVRRYYHGRVAHVGAGVMATFGQPQDPRRLMRVPRWTWSPLPQGSAS